MVSVPSSERGRDTESTVPNDQESDENSSPTLPPAVLHEVLVNDRRRAIVDLLDEEISLRDLADRVARIETGGDDPDRKTRQSVYITLHQCHLPKLDEFGVVDYDSDRKRVRPAEGLAAIRSYRGRIDDTHARLSRSISPLPYLGLGLLGVGCLLAGATGVAPAAWYGVACGASLVVVGLAGWTVWSRRQE